MVTTLAPQDRILTLYAYTIFEGASPQDIKPGLTDAIEEFKEIPLYQKPGDFHAHVVSIMLDALYVQQNSARFKHVLPHIIHAVESTKPQKGCTENTVNDFYFVLDTENISQLPKKVQFARYRNKGDACLVHSGIFRNHYKARERSYRTNGHQPPSLEQLNVTGKASYYTAAKLVQDKDSFELCDDLSHNFDEISDILMNVRHEIFSPKFVSNI